jgi:ABC-type transport system involved in multi-copper enzyme maturation permease subunit
MSTEERRYPALGPGVWRVLIRNEWFKAQRRLAFLVTFGLFTFITVMEHGGDLRRAQTDDDFSYALPNAWGSVFSEDSVLILIFATMAVIMLVSSEFTWRTARQNVIDGLSKTQWFWGKAMLVVMVGLVFVTTKIVVGGGTAALGTDFAATTAPVLTPSVFAAAFALLLAYLSVASLGLLCSVTIRNSGPAIAVWFFWITLGEQLVPALVTRVLPSLEAAFAYLPFNASQKVLPFWTFDAAAYARVVERAAAAERAAPELPNALLWTGVNAAWVVVFVGVAYWAFRRRDL